MDAATTSSDDAGRVEAVLRATSEILDAPDVSRRPLLGSVVLSVKRMARRLLASVLSRQVEYNRTNLALVTSLARRLEALEAGEVRRASDDAAVADALRWLRDRLGAADAAIAAGEAPVREAAARIAALEAGLAGVSDEHRRVRDDLQAAEARLLAAVRAEAERTAAVRAEAERAAQDLGARATHLERRLRRIVHLLAGSGERPPAPPAPPPDEPVEPLFDALAFEDACRGPEAELRERQRPYLAHFEGRQDVLDVGCGRGEFLELLRDAGIRAVGVDANLDAVLACREKGLTVVHGDAFEHLRALPDGSLGGVFAAQVVEHLGAAQIIEMVRLAYRKLQPGAAMILETVNPSCLTVFAESFYMDLTHIRPIHHLALRFVAQAAGFGDVWIRWSAPVDESLRLPALPAEGPHAEAIAEFNRGVTRLNDLLYGHRDYAVVARKVPPVAE